MKLAFLENHLNPVILSKQKSESQVQRTVLCWNNVGWFVSIKLVQVGFSEFL